MITGEEIDRQECHNSTNSGVLEDCPKEVERGRINEKQGYQAKGNLILRLGLFLVFNEFRAIPTHEIDGQVDEEGQEKEWEGKSSSQRVADEDKNSIKPSRDGSWRVGIKGSGEGKGIENVVGKMRRLQ